MSNPDVEQINELYYPLAKLKCETDHLFFTRYFFKRRQGIKFRINWHHILISDAIQDVIDGKIGNLVINVAPGASKTELTVINFIARGLARNPRARFLHLSYSDDLALLNSATARDLITSDDFQMLWPLKIADDSKSKKRWNVLVNGMPAGGVYATSLGGQITGFRAGNMTEDFQGAIIIDDPLKPEDAFSKPKLAQANRKLLTTVKSRKANPKTPIVLIMQRISENDPTAFIKKGGMQGKWTFLTIPAVIDDAYIDTLPPKYRKLIETKPRDDKGRFSYWPYKEPIADLNTMEKGEGVDLDGGRISRHVFSSQYQQDPTSLGGNIIKGSYFPRYTVLPKIKYRKIFGDTAQKTAERNDYSVFECWGYGEDNKIYLLDMIRGKWEAPELKRKAIEFWNKHKGKDVDHVGQLREMLIEDKTSGTGLIQEIKAIGGIPVKGIERNKDKYVRVNDGLPYLEAGLVCVPADAPYTSGFISENESFTADDTHEHDDQVDPMLDAINDMLSRNNKIKQWENLAG